MADGALRHLTVDLEEGRVDLDRAQELASAVPPEPAPGKELGALIAEATGAYTDGKSRFAWAAASVAAAVSGAWIDRPTRLWPRRVALREGSLDIRARALALLGFIEADQGGAEAATTLSRDSEALIRRMAHPTRARFVIGATAAERALKLRRADEAIAILRSILRLPDLGDSERGAAQALLATALNAADRVDEAVRAFEETATSFRRAGLSAGALGAELERGVLMSQSGDVGVARSLLTEVAAAAVATGNDAVEARAQLHLGVIAGAARRHREAAEHFTRAASATRRGGDMAAVIVALRNAADELRHEGDFIAAERLLLEALAVPATPAVAVDRAKAKYFLAVLRHQQGRREDADRLLNEASADFEDKLIELGVDGSRQGREHVEGQLRTVAALREQLSR
jgi:tetratricopeptide (TPR) repeat protein